MKKLCLILLVFCMLTCMASCAEQSDEFPSFNSGYSSNSNSSVSDSNSTSNRNVVASIITNDGEQKNMTAQDLADLDDANEVAFKNKYFGASVTLEANVVKVSSRTMREGYYMESYLELEDGWIIETDPNEVADLFPGDTVKAEGNIFSTDSRGFVTIQIYRVNGHTTKVTKIN